jgi:hypothetical protein
VDQGVEVERRSGDHAHVDRDLVHGARGADLAAIERAQQGCLGARRKGVDRVQEQRSAVGARERAGRKGGRSEQCVLDRGRVERSAVEDDEGSVAAGALVMERPREGSPLVGGGTEQEDGDRALGGRSREFLAESHDVSGNASRTTLGGEFFCHDGALFPRNRIRRAP